MAKVVSVEDALKEIKAEKNDKGEYVVNRFNKKKFETLMLAMANDSSVEAEHAKIKNGEVNIEKVAVTKGFRKFCKKLLEAAGMDRAEANRIEGEDFIIKSVDGLYDFFCEAMYLYMENGNQFDFPSKEDFRGGIRIVDVPEQTKIYDTKNLTGGSNDKGGVKIERKTKKHKKLKAKSSAPTYLSSKRLV